MGVDDKVYLSQGIDYLGFLNAKLRDLRGWATLLNELVQNADDPEDTTQLTLDINDEALVVENNGLFTDCGSIEEACALDPLGDERTCCDFHAFRRVASGHKRAEQDTTGAFGIGFISVYQITDRPSLCSGRWHWVLNPEAEAHRRIEAELNARPFPGTRFVLPWARKNTSLRTRLGLEPVPADVVDRMFAELQEALVLAAPFLKRLTTLELRRRGKTEFVVQCERDVDADQILVESGGQTRIWSRLNGDFSADAEMLRARYGASIESKRKAGVSVAIPLDGLKGEGRLYATLPTEHEIGLPVLINADFFPSSDRKRILFDQDYQGEWNKAAIRAAGRAVADALLELRDTLSPADFWTLINACKETHRTSTAGKGEKAFSAFWDFLAPKIHGGEFVLTSLKKWCAPAQVRLLQSAQDEKSVLPFLEGLGLSIVHLDLQGFSNLLRDRDVGVAYLTLDDLVESMHSNGLTKQIALSAAQPWLQSHENRRQLGLQIERLYDRTGRESRAAVRERVRQGALMLTTGSTLAPPVGVRTADPSTIEIFEPLGIADCWIAETNPQELLSLVDPFSVRDAIRMLTSAGPEKLKQLHVSEGGWIVRVIGWFAESGSSIARSEDLKKNIRALPIWPSGDVLCKLDDLSVPGGFEDPLKLAKILDATIATSWNSFVLEDLGAQQLTLRTYLTEHVPRAFASETPPSDDTRRALMLLLVEHVSVVSDDEVVKTSLHALPIVECADGEFRLAGEAYFDSEMLREIFGAGVSLAVIPEVTKNASQELLSQIGVNALPRADDVIGRIETLTQTGPTADARKCIGAVFKGLAENWNALAQQHESLTELRSMAWLPGTRGTSWFQPSELYTRFLEYLFNTQATFLNIDRGVEQRSTDLIKFLRIPSDPSAQQVVNHLLTLAAEGREVNMQVYEFLNRNVSAPAINGLRRRNCLQLDDSSYVNPARCFWGPHHFATYRVQLGSDWRRYQALLEHLEVGEDPTANDAIAVLCEISDAHSDNRFMTEGDVEVVMRCWSLLAESMHAHTPDWVATLQGRKVVPNTNRVLKYPMEIFFEDRPGLARKFDEALRKDVIHRTDPAWRAMLLAGVRPLSEAVSVELVENVDPLLDEELTERLRERWDLVRRVFATRAELPSNAKLRYPPELWSSEGIRVVYRVTALRSEAEDIAAYFDREAARIYFCRNRRNIEGPIALEIAYGICPEISSGPLAALIRDVLAAESVVTATQMLDFYGVPEMRFDEIATESSQARGIGATGERGVETYDQTDNKKEGADDAEPTTSTQSESDADDSDDESYKEGEPSRTKGDNREPKDRPHHDKKSDIDEPEITKPKKPDQRPQKEGRPMLRSYMSYAGEAEDAGLSDEAKARRKATDDRGIALVLKAEAESGRYPKAMPHTNEGYDIESKDKSGKIARLIEVKSLSGQWDGYGVGISAPQYRKAKSEGEVFWLYVVENTASDNPTIHRIQDPFSKIVDFRFDGGWEIIAESEAAPLK